MGTVYLLHFSRPYQHARHYIGYTENLNDRLIMHRAGNGARIIEIIIRAGIDFELVRTWEGDRKLERRLKNCKHANYYCPICSKERKQNKCTKKLSDLLQPAGISS